MDTPYGTRSDHVPEGDCDNEKFARDHLAVDGSPSDGSARVHHLLAWASTLPAVLFNTGFAIIAIVTLCGIVFITRPKQVIHDIPPAMWLPLLIVMAPAQIYAQILSWRTVFDGQIPTGSAIALRQKQIPSLLRPAVTFLWFCNFCIGFAIVVSLSKPQGGNVVLSIGEFVLIFAIAACLAFAANVYLCLAVRTSTQDEAVLDRVWRLRLWIGVAMGIVGALYYA